MTRRKTKLGKFLLFAVMLCGFGAAPLLAHVSFLVAGKVTKWDKPTLVVATKDLGTVSVKVLDDFAEIVHTGKPATSADLKVGQNVVIDATGDTVTDLEALKVEIDPAPAKAKAK